MSGNTVNEQGNAGGSVTEGLPPPAIRIKSAPGLAWIPRENRFEARWRCRQDIIARPDFQQGFAVKSVKLWSGTGDPSLDEWDFIADTCSQLQREMLEWARGPEEPIFDGTISSLIRCYQTDPDSPYCKPGKLRYASRTHYNVMMGMIKEEYGNELVSEIKGRTIQRWYDGWSVDGKVSTAHTKVKMLRILFNFGMSLLEDADCIRLSGVLSKMKFAMSKPRTALLTAAQATAIRTKAHELGRPSIAMAQALQFELMLRQKDCIGEWIPMSEHVASDVFDGTGLKWLRGVRWEEIDQNLILTHITSKRQKEIKVSLRNAPMVMEELAFIARISPATLTREILPASGPIVVSEFDDLPWEAIEYRRWWRKLADLCGIPKNIRSMDSRAGAISEAIAAGAKLEHIRHGATHSDIGTTQRYDRAAEEAILLVQKLRAERRNRPETE